MQSRRLEKSSSARTRIAASGIALALAGWVLSGAAPAFATDGYFQHGVGTRSKGAGGTAIASPEDSLAIAANPASALSLGDRYDVGFEWFRPDRSATISGNAFGPDATYDGNGAENFFIPEFGYIRQISPNLALGIAVYGNGGMNTDYDSNPYARFGATGDAGVNFEQLFVSPTVSWRVAEGHAIGIAANIVVQRFEGEGIAPFAAASIDPANFSDRGVDTTSGVGWRIGWLGQLSENLRVGAFYQSAVETGGFDNYSGLFADGGGFDVPSSYGVGLNYQVADGVDVAFDVRHIGYSEVASVSNPLSLLTVDGVPLGAPDGPGFGWRDVTAYKIGVNWDVSDRLTLRAGYSTLEQPIPSSETFFNILAPGVVEDHFTVGATWALNDRLELSGYALIAPEVTVRGSGSIPPGAPPGFGGGEADISLSETALGFALGWRY